MVLPNRGLLEDVIKRSFFLIKSVDLQWSNGHPTLISQSFVNNLWMTYEPLQEVLSLILYRLYTWDRVISLLLWSLQSLHRHLQPVPILIARRDVRSGCRTEWEIYCDWGTFNQRYNPRQLLITWLFYTDYDSENSLIRIQYTCQLIRLPVRLVSFLGSFKTCISLLSLWIEKKTRRTPVWITTHEM